MDNNTPTYSVSYVNGSNMKIAIVCKDALSLDDAKATANFYLSADPSEKKDVAILLEYEDTEKTPVAGLVDGEWIEA